MYLSIEGRSIEIDKKIDIFDITSKIAAVSAAPIQSLTPVHGITRGKKPPFVLSKKVGICRASPGLSSFFVLSAARNFSPSFLDTVWNYEMGKLRFRELLSRRQKYIFETMRRNVLSFRSFNFTPSRGYLRRPKKVQLITNPQYVQTWFKKRSFLKRSTQFLLNFI